MKKLFLAAAIALSSVASVMAGGLSDARFDPTVVAPVEVKTKWQGAYVGGNIGFGELTAKSGGNSVKTEAENIGVYAGYRHNFGKVVVGGELGLGLNKLETQGVKQDQTVTLRANVGVPFGDYLVYGTVGAVNGRVQTATQKLRDTGYLVGLGAERFVTERVSVGGEVLYTKYNDFKATGVDAKDVRVNARVTFNF